MSRLGARAFDAIWDAWGLEPPEGLHAGLLAAWGEAHRAYHTLDHLEGCLAVFDALQGEAERPAEIALALWFHDAIYDTKAADNERRSADWAADALREAGADDALIHRVDALVMATAHGADATGGRSPDEALLVDVDLWILGADDAAYDTYAAQVRREYGWVPEEAFTAGRAKVLRGFLQRPRIYATERVHGAREAQARRNLARELAALEAG